MGMDPTTFDGTGGLHGQELISDRPLTGRQERFGFADTPAERPIKDVPGQMFIFDKGDEQDDRKVL